MVSVFPVVGHACVAEDEADQIGEAGLGANVVGENQYATLTLLNTDQGIGRLVVVAAFEEAVTLRSIEDNNPEPCVEVFALLAHGNIRLEERELVARGDVQR